MVPSFFLHFGTKLLFRSHKYHKKRQQMEPFCFSLLFRTKYFISKWYQTSVTAIQYQNSSRKMVPISVFTIQVPKSLLKSGTKSSSLQFKYQKPFRRVVPNPVPYNSSTKNPSGEWYQIRFYTIQVPNTAHK